MANPNPSPATRFGGERGNTRFTGKTSAQKTAELKAAEDSAIIRAKMLSTIREKMESGADPLQFIDPATLKLFRDSEDRAHGTPKQAVEHTSPDGSMSPQGVPAEIAAELAKKLME